MTANNSTISPAQPVTVFPTSKVCTGCKQDKSFSEFGPRKAGKLRLQSMCKLCTRDYLRGAALRRTPDQLERRALTNVRNNMIHRCYDDKRWNYANYGARGITVCDRWLDSLDNFISDMGPRPTGYQIDRIDNDAGYSPENCRWATISENQINKRTCRNSKLGITGVTMANGSRYHAEIKRNGIKRIKYFSDFFEACCYRKSLENQFNNTGTI